MSELPSFECECCQERVSPTAYRATCPDCGGNLRHAPVR